jgi:hypothetical protein
MSQFSLDHLTDVEFEQFCHDLLREVGFVNIDWRKGTGLSASPADSGRDIECEYERSDPDGSKHLEKWFVECKHHLKGVSPDRIQSVLAWAGAGRPNVVLIIASNFLSNSTKNYIEQYKSGNRPPYRIVCWERPQLEKLASGRTGLLRRYRIEDEMPFLSILHPAHLNYIREAPVNTLAFFFGTLEGLDPEKRDQVLGLQYHQILRPRYRRSVSGKETLAELLIDDVSYGAFRDKCYMLSRLVDPGFLIFSIVAGALSSIFKIADKTDVQAVVDRHRSSVRYFESLLVALEEGSSDLMEEIDAVLTVFKRLPNFRDEDLESELRGAIGLLEESITKVPGNTERHYLLYEYFCDQAVRKLLTEEIVFELPEMMPV